VDQEGEDEVIEADRDWSQVEFVQPIHRISVGRTHPRRSSLQLRLKSNVHSQEWTNLPLTCNFLLVVADSLVHTLHHLRVMVCFKFHRLKFVRVIG
jgi:hypothetical protein